MSGITFDHCFKVFNVFHFNTPSRTFNEEQAALDHYKTLTGNVYMGNYLGGNAGVFFLTTCKTKNIYSSRRKRQKNVFIQWHEKNKRRRKEYNNLMDAIENELEDELELEEEEEEEEEDDEDEVDNDEDDEDEVGEDGDGDIEEKDIGEGKDVDKFNVKIRKNRIKSVKPNNQVNEKINSFIAGFNAFDNLFSSDDESGSENAIA